MAQVNQKSEPPMNLEAAVLLRFNTVLRNMFAPIYFGPKWDDLDDKMRYIIEESARSLTQYHGRGIFFMGSVGCGKTTALRIIAERYFKHRTDKIKERTEKEGRDIDCSGSDGRIMIRHDDTENWAQMDIHIDIEFITHARLIRKLRKEMENNDESPRYNDSRIMMIDDLGRAYEDKSGWNLSLQEEFFNYRWEHQLPTFVTTNYTSDDLRKWEGWQRIVDRLGDKNWMTAYIIPGGSKR